MLQVYFQRLMHSKENLNDKLLNRMCIRIRLPSLSMEIEKKTSRWTLWIGRAARRHPVGKVKRHVEDAIEAIGKLTGEVPLKKFYTRTPFNLNLWETQTFERWRKDMLTENPNSRVVDELKELSIEDDALDTKELKTEEKRSG